MQITLTCASTCSGNEMITRNSLYSAFICSLFKSRGTSFYAGVKVVFGQNVSGLSAAMEWVKVWPDMQGDILVTCSVYRLGQKVRVVKMLFFFNS